MDSFTQPQQQVRDREILTTTPVNHRGALKPFVNLRLGALIITDCRVIKEPRKKRSLDSPVLSYKGEYGTTLYKLVVQITDDQLKTTFLKWFYPVGKKEGEYDG